MADERNFRTYYYEKFGVRTVEEKRSIEILLKEQPLNIEKLFQFCWRFPVPSMYRVLVWKFLLGILPSNQSSQEFVWKQRKQQYEDLLHAVRVLGRVNSHTPLSEVFLKMYLVEEGALQFQEDIMLSKDNNKAFMAMAEAVSKIEDDPVSSYWITTRFFRHFDKFKDSLLTLPLKTEQYLQKEDSHHKLYDHLHKYKVFSSIPVSAWFHCCFAGILPETSFEKIWDKVLGGSCMILVFVAVAIFMTFHRPLLSMTRTEDMVNYLRKISEDTGDILVNKAIDLWQKYGCHLKSDSPVFLERPPT
ncbi:TBC1 domain family member 7-like [Liolophura sinensis]|uniref:TBC1 domain family member 7-like n=1 Tax=Liolophura sinensis TaxID=3198878 RepID=UPI0031595FFE